MKATLMRRSGIVLILGLAAAMSSCGSNPPTAAGNNNKNNGVCTITLSGAQTGSPTCSNVTAIRTSNDNKTLFGFDGANASDTLSVVVGFDGEPAVQTYANGTAQLIGGSMIWQALNGTLVVTSVKLLNSGAGLTSYEVHGSFTATMAAEVSDGSIGPVTVTATF